MQLQRRLHQAIYPISTSQASQSNVTNASNILDNSQLDSTIDLNANGQWDLIKVKQGPVLKRIPKASRLQVSIAYKKIIDRIMANPLEKKCWEEFHNFPRLAIGCSIRGGKKNKSLASVVNKRVESFMAGKPEEISVKKKKKGPPSIEQRVSAKLADFDVQGAVRILTSKESVLQPSAETKAKLQEKHPQQHSNSSNPPLPDDSIPCFSTDKKAFLKALRSFKRGIAGGADGLTPQHMRDMCEESLGEAAHNLIDTMVKFFNTVVYPGKIPWEVCPTFYGANLMALAKPDNGVRPIAIGSTPRRLAAKIIAQESRSFSEYEFSPNQVGVSMPKGAEGAVHALRAYIENPAIQDKVVLKIDFKNAYNTIRRDVMLNKIKKKLPKIYNYVYQCYSRPSNLFYDKEILQSCEGVHQGDPIGGLLFSVGIQEDLVKNIESELNCWYLDDGTIAGDTQSVLSDFKNIINAAESHGLEINATKCELFLIQPSQASQKSTLNSFNQVKAGVKLVENHELTLLGAPILPEAIEGVLMKKIEDLELMSKRLDEIDPHSALFLLRHCFAMPKLTYFLRTAPCFIRSDLLESFDKIVKSSLIKILNIQLEESAYSQATLPVALGGLGFRPAAEISIPGFLSSVHACKSIANSLLPTNLHSFASPHWENALGIWKEKAQMNAPPDAPIYQSSWDKPLYENRFQSLFNTTNNDQDIARLLSVSAESASDWLHAFPLATLGLHLDPSSLRIAAGLRLGSNLCHPHLCKCGKMVDQKARHGLACKNQVGRHSRHNEINDLIKRALVQSKIAATTEPRGLFRTDGKRPDGMTQFPWKQGKCLVYDVTVADTVCASYVKNTSKSAGAAADLREAEKKTKYVNLSRDYLFIPVGIETFGSWGNEGLKLIKDIGKKLKEASGEPRSTFFLTQRISTALQRGNASCVLGTVPFTNGLEAIFEFDSHEELGSDS